MIKRKDLLIFSDEKIVSNIVKYEEEDIYIFQELYTNWMELNEKIKRIGGRPSVLPTEFVEALVAFKMNYWKIDDMRLGFDCYDPNDEKNEKRIEIKYSTGRMDYSSFAPKIEWDRLNFVKFYNESPIECYFEVYDIGIDMIFEETEKFGRSVYEGYGRRPRISISRELIERGIYRNKKEFSLF